MSAFSDSRRVGRRVALDDLAVAADQELGEVPLDRLAAEHARRLGASATSTAGARCVAVDVDLGHHRKPRRRSSSRRTTRSRRSARVLGAELVAREADHHQAAVAVVFHSSSRPANCGVKPHALAVLTISSTLPRWRRQVRRLAVDRLRPRSRRCWSRCAAMGLPWDARMERRGDGSARARGAPASRRPRPGRRRGRASSARRRRSARRRSPARGVSTPPPSASADAGRTAPR